MARTCWANDEEVAQERDGRLESAQTGSKNRREGWDLGLREQWEILVRDGPMALLL